MVLIRSFLDLRKPGSGAKKSFRYVNFPEVNPALANIVSPSEVVVGSRPSTSETGGVVVISHHFPLIR